MKGMECCITKCLGFALLWAFLTTTFVMLAWNKTISQIWPNLKKVNFLQVLLVVVALGFMCAPKLMSHKGGCPMSKGDCGSAKKDCPLGNRAAAPDATDAPAN